MSGSKFIAVMAALIGIVAVCVLGIYLYQRESGPPQTAEDGTTPGTTPGVVPAEPKADDQSVATPKEPTVVPSFDIVRVEKSGDGVMAGRAAAGWTIKVVSGEVIIAETIADEEGAWTVVLETPLPPGDHELVVTATSPDGTNSLSSQDPVKVAVAETERRGQDIAALPEAVAPAEPEPDGAAPSAPQDNASAADSTASETGPDAVAADETAPASEDEIPGDKSLIQNPYVRPGSEPPAEAGAEPQSTPDMAEGEIPGDKSLIEKPYVRPGSESPAEPGPGTQSAQTDGEDIPGDKSLIEPAPRTLAREPSGSPEASDEASSEAGGVPGQPEPVLDPPPAGAPVHKEKPPVVFKTVDYQDTGPDSGKITAGGEGDPGAQLRIYFDDRQIGEAVIGEDGKWSFETELKLEPGDHVLRADRLQEGTGMPGGRASVSMRRVKPEPEVAAKPDAPAEEAEDAAASASPTPPTEDKIGAEAPEMAAAKPEQDGSAEQGQRPSVYAIKRGDTLWDIAEEYLGGGWRYKKIARQNRKVIRNPHWIYPDQEVRLPKP